MEMLYNCLLVGIGGAVGSVTRYLVGLIPIKSQNSFPLTTLIINVIGAFCGGFTTFSTFSLETVGLLQRGSYFSAGIYMVLSVILCICAILFAQAIVK